jgi:lysozyme family protein
MSNFQHLTPFILKSEGGLSKKPKDSASAHPVPDGSGYHTNIG